MARPLQPFRLERFFAVYEFAVKHHLCASDCQSLTVKDLLAIAGTDSADACSQDKALEFLTNTWLGYTETAGNPELRRAIAKTCYDGSIGPDDVLVHVGAEEAIFTFCHAALNAGDVVIVQEPCYQSVSEIPASVGCTVLPWRMAFDEAANAWSISLDELEALITKAGKNLKAIFVNTPHNPTGYQFSSNDFRRLVRIVEDLGILLFVDEVYRMLELPGNSDRRLPAAAELSPNCISLNVLSKSFGMAGLRIGWIAAQKANQPLLARMATIKDYTTICAAAPAESLAILALREPCTARRLLDRTTAVAAKNVAAFDAFFERHADVFGWEPKTKTRSNDENGGGAYGVGIIGFAKLKNPSLLLGADTEKADVDAFIDLLVRETGVLLLPGSRYGDEWKEFFRIGYGKEGCLEGLEALERWIIARKKITSPQTA